MHCILEGTQQLKYYNLQMEDLGFPIYLSRMMQLLGSVHLNKCWDKADKTIISGISLAIDIKDGDLYCLRQFDILLDKFHIYYWTYIIIGFY